MHLKMLQRALSYYGNPRPAEYLSLITTQEISAVEVTGEENTYQPMVLIRSHQHNTSEYQSLLHLATSTQPHETPPPIPPKPKNV